MAKLRSPAHSILFLESRKTHQHIKDFEKSYKKKKKFTFFSLPFPNLYNLKTPFCYNTFWTLETQFLWAAPDRSFHSWEPFRDHPPPPRPFVMSYLPLSKALRASKFLPAKLSSLVYQQTPQTVSDNWLILYCLLIIIVLSNPFRAKSCPSQLCSFL